MERVPHKVARPRIKKRWIILLILVLVICAVGLVQWLNRPTAYPDPVGVQRVQLLNRSSDEIEAILLEQPGNSTIALIQDEEGVHFLAKPEWLLRDTLIEEILNNLTHFEADSVVADLSENEVNLEDFGLEEPRLRLIVSYRDGEKKIIDFGNEYSGENPVIYCKVKEDQFIYAVLSEPCECFFHEPEYFRAFNQPELNGELLDRIEISGDIQLSIYYTPSGWYMESPYRYPTSQTALNSFLNHIESMAFESLLGNAEDVDLSQYGLDQPALSITLTQGASVINAWNEDSVDVVTVDVPEKTYQMAIGNETGFSGVYVLYNGQVFKASNYLLGFWKELKIDDFLLREPVNFLTNDLITISYTCGEKNASYGIELVESITENNQIATDEYGQILYELEARDAQTGKIVDANAFLTWYAALNWLTPAGRVEEDYVPEGDLLAAINLCSNSVTRTIKFYPYDALHMALLIDDVCIFYVNRSFLTTLIDSPS